MGNLLKLPQSENNAALEKLGALGLSVEKWERIRFHEVFARRLVQYANAGCPKSPMFIGDELVTFYRITTFVDWSLNWKAALRNGAPDTPDDDPIFKVGQYKIQDERSGRRVRRVVDIVNLNRTWSYGEAVTLCATNGKRPILPQVILADPVNFRVGEAWDMNILFLAPCEWKGLTHYPALECKGHSRIARLVPTPELLKLSPSWWFAIEGREDHQG